MKKKLVSLLLAMALFLSCFCSVQMIVFADIEIPDITQGWTWPLDGYTNITSGFGKRSSGYHQGIDIGAPAGTPIYAARKGDVCAVGTDSSMGNYVCIYHGICNGQKIYTTYMHMKEYPYVSKGQSVDITTQLGIVGTTGDSKGNHLHFHICHPSGSTYISPSHSSEAILNQNYVDPSPSNISYSYDRHIPPVDPYVNLGDDFYAVILQRQACSY